MLAEIGAVALFAALIAAVLSVVLAVVSAWSRQPQYLSAARNAMLLTFPLILFAAGVLIFAQVSGHYEISYVNSVSKDAQPLTLKITALWGGQAGSLVLWSFLLSAFTCAALLFNWKQEYHLMPWVIVVAGGTLAFFLVLNNFYEKPFVRTWKQPTGDPAFSAGETKQALFQPEGMVLAYPFQTDDGPFYHEDTNFRPELYFQFMDPRDPQRNILMRSRLDGRGLNPLLRHPGMIIHPPMLYLGFTGFIMPFAFAMAALITGNFGTGWMKATRRWSLIAWVFLSLGLILGGRWAYDVLGWGGYWGWDPVENSSFLPWLTGTAFLHSVMIQERRGMLKGWNMVMIILTYLLVLFGTVATRTGLLSSVHSFAQSPLSVPMSAFLGFTIIACIGLFFWRGSQGAFENDHELEGMLSRESLFLFNNWIFLAITVVVFWGTWSELITGFMRDFGLLKNTINLGPEYYLMIVPWLFAILFILMGVAPLAAWRRASAEKLGMSLSIPLVLTVIVFAGLSLTDHDLPVAFGFSTAAFAGFATFQELYKGAEARHRAHSEPWITALRRLFERNRRRYGGYLIHLGVVILGIGIISSTAFQEVRQDTLAPGETMDIGSYTLRYEKLVWAGGVDGREMIIAETTLLKDGKVVDHLRPRRDFFDANSSPMTIAGTHATLENDVYALITFWEGQDVTLRVFRNPLISFVWWGGLLFVLGTVIAIFPEGEKRTVTRPQTVRATAPVVAAGD